MASYIYINTPMLYAKGLDDTLEHAFEAIGEEAEADDPYDRKGQILDLRLFGQEGDQLFFH